MHYRIVAFGKFSNWISFFLHGVIEGAIRNGWQADRVELMNPCRNRTIRFHLEGIKEQLLRVKPHVIFCHSITGEKAEFYEGLFDVLKIVKKYCGTKIAYHIADPRSTLRYPRSLAEIVDIGLVNTDLEDYLEKCRQTYKIPCYFWPFACWQTNEIGYVNNTYDMIFLGYMSKDKRYIERTRFVRLCQKNKILNLKVLNEKLGRTHFYNRDLALESKGVLAISAPKFEEYSLDARPFIFGGYGGVVFTKKISLAEKIFEDKKHLVFFDDIVDPEELIELFKKYGNNKRIRKSAFTYIQECHNYKNRVRDVIDILEGKIDRPRVFLGDFDEA